eukprot:361871-Chlamydomonas_euryale.AAC.8
MDGGRLHVRVLLHARGWYQDLGTVGGCRGRAQPHLRVSYGESRTERGLAPLPPQSAATPLRAPRPPPHWWSVGAIRWVVTSINQHLFLPNQRPLLSKPLSCTSPGWIPAGAPARPQGGLLALPRACVPCGTGRLAAADVAPHTRQDLPHHVRRVRGLFLAQNVAAHHPHGAHRQRAVRRRARCVC